LLCGGADVFRLNLRPGQHTDPQRRLEILREVERQGGRPIGVLLDLQGPKLRIGTFPEGPIQLTESQAFRLDLDTEASASNSRVLLPHPEIFAVLEPGAE